MKGFKVKSAFNLKPKVANEQQQNQKLRQAAKMYEKQFLREMMKAMRNTVKHSEFSKPGFAEKIYRNQLDEQYAEKWGDTGGIGLSDLIYEQIKERMDSIKNIQQPQGPIPLNKGPKFIDPKNNMIPVKKNDKDLSFILPNSDSQNKIITAPWGGQVSNQFKHGHQSVIEIAHDNDLQSLIAFSGKAAGDIGKEVHAGQRIGDLSDVTANVLWKLS